MSFGYSVGDFIAVGHLAWSVYKSCKEAPESFGNISVEVLSLHAVLKEVEELLEDQPLSASKKNSLATITSGCQDVLKDLQRLTKKYESLGTKSKRTWDRMRWGSNDIAELRQRLTSNTVMLTAFVSTFQVVVEKKLNALIQDFHDGRREASVISIATAESLTFDDKQMWREIRKELESIGISVAAFDANKAFILEWFQKAVETGAFEEQRPEGDSNSLSSRTDSRPSSRSLDEFADGTLTHGRQNHFGIFDHASHAGQNEEVASMSETIFVQTTIPSNLPPSQIDSAKSKGASRAPKYKFVDRVSDVKKQPVSRSDLSTEKIPTSTALRRKVPKRLSKIARWCAYASFLEACEYENISAARNFLKKGADVNARSDDERNETALIQSSARGSTTMVHFLLDSGADIDAQDISGTALHAAVRQQAIETVALLCERGANVHIVAYHFTPLGIALFDAVESATSVSLDIAKLLVEKGASESTYRLSYSLRRAVEMSLLSEQVDNIRFLLDQGADVNYKHAGPTPLHAAVDSADHDFQEGHQEASPQKEHTKLTVLKMLLDKNPDLEKQDDYDYTALDYAIANEKFTAVQLLVKYGAVNNYRKLVNSPFVPDEREDPTTNQSRCELYEYICRGYARIEELV